MINMKYYRDQRVCILVDVQNMYYSAKNLYNSKVNFEEIIKRSLNGRRLIRAVAYAIKADVRDEKNFHEALENIGFEVRTKELLVFHGGHKKGDWDVGIAMDAVRASEKCDVIVVVSGDGDFKELYEYVRGKGCRIEVLAFGKTASSSIKDYVDLFIDMDKDRKFLIPLKGGLYRKNDSGKKPSQISHSGMKPKQQFQKKNPLPKLSSRSKNPIDNPAINNINNDPLANLDETKEQKKAEEKKENKQETKQEKKPEEKPGTKKSKQQKSIFKKIIKKMKK